MIRIHAIFSALIGSLFLLGCVSIKQKFENIRATETILFEGRAQIGDVYYDGDMIFWNNTSILPVLATPTTLYYSTYSIPYTQIESVDVASFLSKKLVFGKDTTFEDLLIVTLPYGRKQMFLLIPDSKKRGSPDSDPKRRELATELASVIERQRNRVDPFGLVSLPNQIGISTWPGQVYEYWSVTPLYLKEKYPSELKAIEVAFKTSRESSTKLFLDRMRSIVLENDSIENEINWRDLGDTKLDWLHHNQIRKRLEGRTEDMDRAILLDTTRIFLEEKFDPMGNPSVKATFSTVARLYDVKHSRLSQSHILKSEVTLPVETWLNRGTRGIESELEIAMQHFAKQLILFLKPNNTDVLESQ